MDALIHSVFRKQIRLMLTMSRKSEDIVFGDNGKSETYFARLKALVKDLLTSEKDEEWKDL